MRIVNLTPHAVTVLGQDGKAVVIPPSGTLARVSVRRNQVSRLEIDGTAVPVYSTDYGGIEGLPAPEAGTYYIVSRAVAEAARRDDLLVPDDLVRDAGGAVVGCRSFSVIGR
jgi:hypothetical protein